MRILDRLALVLVPALALAGCAAIEGSGHVVTEERAVGAFDALTAGGGLHVVATVDPTLADGASYVAVTTDDNLQQYVTMRVESGRLIVSQDEHLDPTGDLVVEIVTPGLVAAHCRDACRMQLTGVDEPEFDLRVSDASFVDIRATAARMVVDVRDASNVDGDLAQLASLAVRATQASSVALAGDAESVTIAASDASTVDLTRLRAQDVDASASDATRIAACARGHFEHSARVASTVRNPCASTLD